MKVRLKPMLQKQQAWSEQSFNSMKVRLKLFGMLRRSYVSLFQFHEGPIKTHLTMTLALLLLCFNSMKVRLKRANTKTRPNKKNLFQFHEGPIKTLKTITMLLILPMFQFHEGPIKTCKLEGLQNSFGVSIP